jgi:hypothetical protein
LKKSQLQLAHLLTENRDLKLQLASAEACLPKRSKKKGPILSPALAQHEGQIHALGQAFSIMGELWVDPSSFLQPPPPPGAADSPNHYDSPENMKRGVVAKLYDFVPDELHKYMSSHSNFGDQVHSSYLSIVM